MDFTKEDVTSRIEESGRRGDNVKEFKFPNIDMELTGKRIKQVCEQQKLSARDVQRYLNIGAFQSVYNWFNGKTLPSLDNMLALSRLLGTSIENLIVCKEDKERIIRYDILYFESSTRKRLVKYREKIEVA